MAISWASCSTPATRCRGHVTVAIGQAGRHIRITVTDASSPVRAHEVIDADGPLDAIAQCADESRRPALLLTDVVMPGMSGVELSKRLRELQPGLRVLSMSGYTHNVVDRYGLDGSAVQEALAAEPPNSAPE